MTRRTNGHIHSSANPHPVDIHVGRRLRELRIAKGLSQERVAESLGVTFQQVQKQEKAANRMSASALHDVAKALDVPIGAFFEGLDTNNGAPVPTEGRERTELELMRHFKAIGDAKVRRSIFELVKAAAKSGAAHG